MTITIYSKPIPENIKDKIIDDNIVKYLGDYNEEYIKRELMVNE